ncbi:MAG: S24/S26 family peptidase [Clostridia bacterium]|nr:S24/S26 family peptidase [Clostridia bacterium]
MEEKSTFEEILNRDGRLVYTNVGISMMPLIREGRDIIVIEKCDVSALKKYDAVLFKRENVKGRGRYVLHRILKVLPDNNFYIVGDHDTSGETVNAGQILGVLTDILRDGKKYDFGSFGYKAYIFFICTLYPMRFACLRIKRFLKYAVGAVLYKLKLRR